MYIYYTHTDMFDVLCTCAERVWHSFVCTSDSSVSVRLSVYVRLYMFILTKYCCSDRWWRILTHQRPTAHYTRIYIAHVIVFQRLIDNIWLWEHLCKYICLYVCIFRYMCRYGFLSVWYGTMNLTDGFQAGLEYAIDNPAYNWQKLCSSLQK